MLPAPLKLESRTRRVAGKASRGGGRGL